MIIRTRLTLWYAGILMVGLALTAACVYHEMFAEHPGMARQLATEGHTPGEEVAEVLLYGALPALALALVGGWLLMRSALAPVTRLTQAFERLNANNLHQQIARTGNGDELDRLTEVFNAMTHRLDDSFQRVREFTLHASHELKTPLSLMHNELDTTIHEESLSAAERHRAANLLQEVERLALIVDGLMFLTKADAGLLTLDRAPVRLDELVRDACDDAEVLGHPQQIRCRLEDCAPLTVSGDRRRLRQLLLILTDNAVKYNQPGGSIVLALRQQPGRALLSITNSGPGIPAELLERVFDRFFRGDASHNRAVEGCGLGLSIAQRIVRAHGGEVRVASQVGRETTVTAVFPASIPVPQLDPAEPTAPPVLT